MIYLDSLEDMTTLKLEGFKVRNAASTRNVDEKF